MLIIDELDGIGTQRQEYNMHSDEKRQVNELLTQLDRISNKGVVVVATTNYLRGIDTAVQRSGRFDLKVAVFPPNKTDRAAIFKHYIRNPGGFPGITDGGAEEFLQELAEISLLFSPADIKAAVDSAARRTFHEPNGPSSTEQMLRESVQSQMRSIGVEMAQEWLDQMTQDNRFHQAEIEAFQQDIEIVRNRAAGINQREGILTKSPIGRQSEMVVPVQIHEIVAWGSATRRRVEAPST